MNYPIYAGLLNCTGRDVYVLSERGVIYRLPANGPALGFEKEETNPLYLWNGEDEWREDCDVLRCVEGSIKKKHTLELEPLPSSPVPVQGHLVTEEYAFCFKLKYPFSTIFVADYSDSYLSNSGDGITVCRRLIRR